MRILLMVLLKLFVSVQEISGFPPYDLSDPMQILKTFGFQDMNIGESSNVSMGKGKRKGDSPIYYIKLPPIPQFYMNDHIPRIPPPPNTFHQLNVDFTNNGKPEQIYHWNYKPDVPMLTPSTNPNMQPSYISNEVYNPIRMPPEIPLIAKPIKPIKPAVQLSAKPWISFKKDFIYNGRPSGVYVWKPRSHAKPKKYKHPYFKHFNY